MESDGASLELGKHWGQLLAVIWWGIQVVSSPDKAPGFSHQKVDSMLVAEGSHLQLLL